MRLPNPRSACIEVADVVLPFALFVDVIRIAVGSQRPSQGRQIGQEELGGCRMNRRIGAPDRSLTLLVHRSPPARSPPLRFQCGGQSACLATVWPVRWPQFGSHLGCGCLGGTRGPTNDFHPPPPTPQPCKPRQKTAPPQSPAAPTERPFLPKCALPSRVIIYNTTLWISTFSSPPDERKQPCPTLTFPPTLRLCKSPPRSWAQDRGGVR